MTRALRTNRRRLSPRLPPSASSSDTSVTTLENGLTVIVREDHSAPVVSVQAWCRTGSIDEGQWLGAGLSHVLEHMLFKGTTTRPGHRIDQEVQEAGGQMNAYTSFDRTVYWINVPQTGSGVALDILCDIMRNATLPDDELSKELDVIRREMDMGQDDPQRRSGRRLFETAYTRSPYRFPIIGCLDIFNELRPADIRAYYHQRYAPNNVFYVVTGDIETKAVLAQIGAAYSGVKARALAPSILASEPTQVAPREGVEEAAVELGHLHMSWHIPDLRHPDVPVLDVLSTLLGGGRSSRLYQQVREKQGLAHSVDAWTYSPGNPGLFGVSAVFDGNRFLEVREALLSELNKMRKTPVTRAELGKAVKQFTAATLSTRKTMQGQAQDLGGSWLAAQDLGFSERYLDAVKRVRPADLRRVARQYLTDENRTVYALLPRGSTPASSVRVGTAESLAIRMVELPSGLRLLLKEDHRLPFVDFRAVFRGGVLAENPADSGATQFLSRLLLKGTRTRSAEQIAREIESVGGSLDSFGGNNSFGLSAEVMSADFVRGLELVSDSLLNSTFPAEAVEREREIQLAGIRAQRDQLLPSAFRAMRRTLFGEAGYGLDSLGSEESVAALTASRLREFHQRLNSPRNCVLAIFGDIKPAQVQAAVQRQFGRWRAPSVVTLPSVPKPGAGPAARRIVETRDKKQAVVVVGFPGLSLESPERYALELIQETCSDLGSRLFIRIRDQLGLAYYVGAQNFVGLAPGYFAFYCGTAPEHAARVEEELLKEAGLLRENGLNEEELNRAKAKIVGQHKIARQELGHLATATALDELYGLGYANSDHEDARYAAVTIEDIRATARKYLDPETAVVAIVGPGGS